MRIKKKAMLLVFLVLAVSMFGLVEKASNKDLYNVGLHQDGIMDNQAEKQALRFLQKKMQSRQGILYYSVEYQAPIAYSVLESMGQAMEYAALSDNRNLFEYYAKVTDKYFKDPTGYYYWKIDVDTKIGETSTALVDDLRLAKAYFIARERKLGDYDRELRKLSEVIFSFNVDIDGYPCDYYDGGAKQKAGAVSLFYLDVETMEKLSFIDDKWRIPHANAKNILLNMPENRFGFYPQMFVIDTKQYQLGPTVNMVENLYTALYAHRAGKNNGAFLTFLKSQVKGGKIYNQYNLDGTAVDQYESTAVYALAARLFALGNEADAANWCYRRTLQFQIGDGNSFTGGFGDSDSGLVYAFDQLEALLMLRMVEIKDVGQ